eukprot:10989386-Prorocentrum_lima.AAC.1
MWPLWCCGSAAHKATCPAALLMVSSVCWPVVSANCCSPSAIRDGKNASCPTLGVGGYPPHVPSYLAASSAGR